MSTLKDIASELSISVAAVSFVLNNKAEKAGIGKETAKKIIDCAERLNYKPHLNARALRSGKTNTVGVLMPVHSGVYWLRAAALQTKCMENGYFALFSLWHQHDEEKRACDAILERQPDAIISFTSSEKLLESKVPVVYYSNPAQGRDYVVIDYDSHLRQTAELIAKRGFKKVLHCRKFSNSSFPESMNLEKYAEGRFEVSRMNVQTFSGHKLGNYKSAYHTAEEYFREKNRVIPDIIVGTDEIVMGIGSFMHRKLGLHLPDDLALLGFDNLPECESYITPLSSFETDDMEFADALFSLIQRRLKKPDATPKHIKIIPHFIERESLNKKLKI